MAPQPDPWSLRASDADRDRYLALLREAYAEGRLDGAEYEERMHVALAAKTYRDLVPVLAELPVDPGRLPGPPVAHLPARIAPTEPVPVPGPLPGGQYPAGESRQVVAVFSSTSKQGPWLLPDSLPAVAVLGEVKLDLTNAVLSGPITEIKCFAIMGEINLIVPDSLRLEVDGVPIMAEFDQVDKRKGSARDRIPAPGAPLIRVTGVSVMGSVKARIVVPKGGAAGVRMIGQALPPPPTRAELPPAAEDHPEGK